MHGPSRQQGRARARGRCGGALGALALAFAVAPPARAGGGPEASPWAAEASFAAGCRHDGLDEHERAREAFRRCIELGGDAAKCGYYLACGAARAGDPHAALTWLERAAAAGLTDAALLAAEPDLASLRGRHEFDALCARLRAAAPATAAEDAEAPALAAALDLALPRLSADGLLATTGAGARVFVWDVLTGRLLRVVPRAGGPAVEAAHLADGALVMLEEGGAVARLELAGRAAPRRTETGLALARLERATPEALLLLTGGGSTGLALDATGLAPACEVPGSAHRALALHAGADRLLTTPGPAGGERAILWRASDGAQVAVLGALPALAEHVVGFDPGGALVFVGARGGESIQLARAADGARVAEPRLAAGLLAAAFRRGADELVTVDARGTSWWSAATGARLRRLDHAVPLTAAAAAPASDLALLFDVAGGRAVVALDGGGVWPLAPEACDGARLADVSADGAVVALVEPDGAVRFVDTRGGATLSRLAAAASEASAGRAVKAAGPAVRALVDAGAALRVAPGLWFDGDAAQRTRARVRVGGREYPLDCYAALLRDPRRVRAAAAGVALAPPELSAPPEVELLAPRGRVATASGRRVELRALARDPDGLAGFEVALDGAPLPEHLVRWGTSARADGAWELRLTLTVPDGAARARVAVRAADATGARSVPALLDLLVEEPRAPRRGRRGAR